jgi:hypothetical protein
LRQVGKCKARAKVPGYSTICREVGSEKRRIVRSVSHDAASAI